MFNIEQEMPVFGAEIFNIEPEMLVFGAEIAVSLLKERHVDQEIVVFEHKV